MKRLQSSKLALITLVYWVLLVYVVSALVWWFIALTRQNDRMATLLINELNIQHPSYAKQSAGILNARNRKTAQYIGEGATFLALILVGAVFVYRATRRQIRLSQQQQNFMMAVTHELKTPIAVAQLNLQTLQKRRLEETQQQKLISNTLQEADRLNSLCNNILLASQLDAGGYKVNKNEVALSELVERSAEAFQTRFPNRPIHQHIQPNIHLPGEELLLQMLVNNLVDNALKYSAKNKGISIDLAQQSNGVLLQVTDEGPGIADSEKKRIFEKFYRIGNETTRTAKGSGLGLYLCKKIAADHNGYIKVTDNPPGGSQFLVELKS